MGQYPPNFLWGVSASSFQIEGAAHEGGRGVSVWDTFCATAGKVARGENADVACDHYHRYAEDMALMTELGVNAYRFSFAWPRIQPTGTGKPNTEGLAFYDRLIDAMLAAGLTPAATVYHWDHPQPIEDAGGWLNRETADRFADYAAILGEKFADRVPMWIPINEPMVTTLLGHVTGEYAPGKTLLYDAIPVAHHQHLAHGRAVQALRAAGAKQIGTANNHGPVWPAGDADGDRAAANALANLTNWLFADPVLRGKYPDAPEILEHLPEGYADDLLTIAAPLDFYGVNYYEPLQVGAPGEGNPLPFELRPLEGYELTNNNQPIVPAAFRELLVSLKERYGDALPPVYITENGCAGVDAVGADGAVHDEQRIRFLDSHLVALREAVAAGVDVRGYFLWSILDNFEWSKGYDPRFGLVHVDWQTLKRTPKDSYAWYREHIRSSR